MREFLCLLSALFITISTYAQPKELSEKDRAQLRFFIDMTRLNHSLLPIGQIDTTKEIITLETFPYAGDSVLNSIGLGPNVIDQMRKDSKIEIEVEKNRFGDQYNFVWHCKVNVQDDFGTYDISPYNIYSVGAKIFKADAASDEIMVSDPIFGIRILFRSKLYAKDGERMVIGQGHRYSDYRLAKGDQIWLEIERNNDDDKNILDISFTLPIDCEYDFIASGALEMALIPANDYHVDSVSVDLDRTSIGKSFNMNGIPFTLADFAPGHVLITADSTHYKSVKKWEYCCRKDGELLTQSYPSSPLTVLDESIADGVNQSKSHIEWFKKSWWNTLCRELTLSREILDNEVHRAPNDQIADTLHKNVGHILAIQLISDDKNADFDSLGIECIERAYAIAKSHKNINTLYANELDELLDEQYRGYSSYGLGVESYYRGVNLNPDFAKIKQYISTYLETYTSTEKLSDIEQELEESISAFRQEYETIGLTQAEVEYLYTVNTKPKKTVNPATIGLWYETNIDADSIIFSTPQSLNETGCLLRTSCDFATAKRYTKSDD